jgi:hypothetical protein
MSFGRRLALFFVLIVLVPTLALVGILLIVSKDSRQGKADAALAAGLQTAIALYDERVADAEPSARSLAGEQSLADGLRSGHGAQLQAFAREAADDPGVAGVSVLGPAGTTEARAGDPGAIAFYELELAEQEDARGRLLVSVTTASQYAADLKRLTGRDLVVTRAGEPLGGTLPVPDPGLEAGETADVDLNGDEHRAHLLGLDEDSDEAALVLGPSE